MSEMLNAIHYYGYEEGEVKLINSVWLRFPSNSSYFVVCTVFNPAY